MSTRNCFLSVATMLCGVALFACTEGVDSHSEPAVECQTIWMGDIAHYTGPAMTLRTCLTETLCSDELVLLLDWDAVDPPPDPACRDHNLAAAIAAEGGPPPQNCRPRSKNIRGIFRDFGGFKVLASLFRPGGDDPSVPMRLSVAVGYLPEFSTRLRQDDKAALTMTADDGQIILDAISQVPYRVASGDLATCTGLQLNLDGTEFVGFN